MTEEKSVNMDRLIVGGLHMDDFQWASHQYVEIGYVLVAFVLDRDGYHWKAVYVKADHLDVSVSVCVSTREVISSYDFV